MRSPAVTRMVEDHLMLIWKAYEWPGGEPSTTELAARLRVTPSTVSANLKKLARDGFIEYEPYGSIVLTDEGHRIAVATVRRHRIIETFLAQQLGLSWDLVHDEADRLEHAVSDLVLDRMNDAIGAPTVDPHGDPIPAADGTMPPDLSRAITELPVGASCTVTRVSDRSPEVLRLLTERGVTVGATVEVRAVNLPAEMIELSFGARRIELSLAAAAAIRVSPGPPEPAASPPPSSDPAWAPEPGPEPGPEPHPGSDPDPDPGPA
ncbi:metal-dependent transcriptional regulator [Leucobacter luti]|nr:metal-dependent transcriptional regulator [Leucobacter luti]MBL3700740.1 metal-dependent transcriptional regulator [Leucobacter luti]